MLVVWARRGKFRPDGSVAITPPSNIPVVTLGVFILWFGWFGFNGGSQLALAGAVDAVAMSNILVNTNLAASAGVIAAVPVSRPLLGRVDLLAGLNGAIAGLVSITAGPNITEPYWAIVIGGIGAVLCTAGLKLLERLQLDDQSRRCPGAGRRGCRRQRCTPRACRAFVFSTSWLLWVSLEKTVGVRVTPAVEQLGQDVAELGMETYPEFVLLPEQEEERERAGSRPRPTRGHERAVFRMRPPVAGPDSPWFHARRRRTAGPAR